MPLKCRKHGKTGYSIIMMVAKWQGYYVALEWGVFTLLKQHIPSGVYWRTALLIINLTAYALLGSF